MKGLMMATLIAKLALAMTGIALLQQCIRLAGGVRVLAQLR